MTLDTKALREAAEQADAPPGSYSRAEQYREAVSAQVAYCNIATPATILALLDRLEKAEADKRALWAALIPPSPRCRDCADFDGRCQGTGRPCDPQEYALEIAASKRISS